MSRKGVASETASMAVTPEEGTGWSTSWWIQTVHTSDTTKHSEMVAYVEEQHGLAHGYANLVAHTARQQTTGGPASEQNPISLRRPKKFALI